MKTKITELTQEQVDKLPVYRDKWLNKVFNYEYVHKTYEEVRDSMQYMYKFCDLDEPTVLYVDSPLACQIACNTIFTRENQVRSQVWGQVRSQVWGQVWGQVGSQVWGQVGSQVGSQVWNQVRSQVWNQVGSQVRSQVDSQVRSQVDSQVRSQVGGQVRSQVGSQVGSQVWGQVGSQVGSQVDSQVDSQVGSQVDSQVGSQVWNQVRSQVGSQVDSQVRSQVRSQVDSQVGSQVWNQVGGQVRSQVDSQVGSQVKGGFKEKSYLFSEYINYSDYGWLSYSDFFSREMDVLTKELIDDIDKIKNFVEHSYMSIQLKGLCVVSRYPTYISRDENHELHNLDVPAISFKDGYGQHYIRGMFVPDVAFKKIKNKTFTMEDWMSLENEEHKSACLRMIEELYGELAVAEFIQEKLTKVDTYVDNKNEKYLINTEGMNVGVYDLFKGKINNRQVSYVRCYCPSSDRMFMLGCESDFKKAEDAIASLLRFPKELKDKISYIQRQGERFSMVFNKEGNKMLKSKKANFSNSNLVSLTGKEYFSLMRYEY